MKTQDEIVMKVRAASGAFDFTGEALVPFLDFEHAREFLKAEATAESWAPTPLTREAVLAELTDYMAFAWGKVEDHRGISAGRSVEKCSAWAWLIADDATMATIEAAPYPQYGAPTLAAICVAFGLPIPDDEETQRMIAGKPCRHDCESGCGA
jgi:hypothetical protein